MPFDFPTSPTTGALVTSSNGAIYRWDGAKWVANAPPASMVQSFNSRTGPVLLAQGDVSFALGYTAYDAANPAHYIVDAPNNANAYVRSANAWTNSDTRYMQQVTADTQYVRLDGTVPMTGALTLFGSPTLAQHAVTKSYADAIPYVVTTTGTVAVTGTTAETNVAALRIPGNSLGRNGVAEINALFSYTNSANTKAMLLRFGTAPGTVTGGVTGATTAATTTASAQLKWILRANNATNSQYIFGAGGNGPFGVSTQVLGPFSVDTTVDVWMNLSASLAVGTETITLVHAYAVVFPHA